MNKIVIGDLLTIGGKKYIVMDKISYIGEEYIFVNEMTDNEENTNNYFTMKIVDDSVILIKEKDILDKLLPIF